MSEAPRTWEPAGLAIEVRIACGASAVGRIIAHEGMWIERLPNGALHITAPEARSAYFAIYSDALLTNRREPYDQRGVSYLPLPYSSLHSEDIDGYGAFLVQTHVDARAIETEVIDDCLISFFHVLRDSSDFALVFKGIARHAGVPPHAMRVLAAPRALIAAA